MDLSISQHQPKQGGRRRHKHKPGDEALCKYASKACYKPRVVKKTGELHRYCDHHRQQANRNQRRLELRRRLREHDWVSPSSFQGVNRSTTRLLPLDASDESLSDASSDDGVQVANAPHCVVSSAGVFEPFREPVELHTEDLASLLAIFAEPTDQRADLWIVEAPQLHYTYQLQC